MLHILLNLQKTIMLQDRFLLYVFCTSAIFYRNQAKMHHSAAIEIM